MTAGAGSSSQGNGGRSGSSRGRASVVSGRLATARAPTGRRAASCRTASSCADPPNEGRISDPDVAAAALVARRPQIGDTRPAPAAKQAKAAPSAPADGTTAGDGKKKRRRPTRSKRGAKAPTVTVTEHDQPERRRGRERNGRPVGRHLMCVQVRDKLTQVAVLEGRSLIEHYVSRPADDISQIHGNIYLGQVQNVLPGMEAAFVDIATPKNAVLYRGDVQYDAEDIVERANRPRSSRS